MLCKQYLIFFACGTYLCQKKQCYVVICVLGDLGGYMGLLIGASVVTVCEFLDFIIYNIMKKKRTKSETNNENTDVTGTHYLLAKLNFLQYEDTVFTQIEAATKLILLPI